MNSQHIYPPTVLGLPGEDKGEATNSDLGGVHRWPPTVTAYTMLGIHLFVQRYLITATFPSEPHKDIPLQVLPCHLLPAGEDSLPSVSCSCPVPCSTTLSLASTWCWGALHPLPQVCSGPVIFSPPGASRPPPQANCFLLWFFSDFTSSSLRWEAAGTPTWTALYVQRMQ